jgi:hypothetical protein
MSNEKVLCPSCKKRYIGEDFALCGVCAGVEKEDEDIYIDNICTNSISNNNLTSSLNSMESAEFILDIKDDMDENEIRSVVEAVLKEEYLNSVSFEKQKRLEHKINRFYVRAIRGAACGTEKGMRFRWFTFTESDEAIETGINFGKAFHKFITWLRYPCPDFQYGVIEHRQGDMWRRNWHILSYGTDKLPLQDMDTWWKANYKSLVTGMAEIRNMRKAIKYVSGYLSEPEKFMRAFFSQGWVFPGWLSFSKNYRKQQSEYPSVEKLIKMAMMSKSQRVIEMEYLIETGDSAEEYKNS